MMVLVMIMTMMMTTTTTTTTMMMMMMIPLSRGGSPPNRGRLPHRGSNRHIHSFGGQGPNDDCSCAMMMMMMAMLTLAMMVVKMKATITGGRQVARPVSFDTARCTYEALSAADVCGPYLVSFVEFGMRATSELARVVNST